MNISNNLLKYAVVDERMSETCKRSLRRYYKLLQLPCNRYFDKPISAHPDLFIFPYHEGFLIEQRASQILASLDDKQMFYFTNPIPSESVVRIRGSKKGVVYPNDCALNFAMCGNHIIGNRQAIHPRIAGLILKYHWNFIPINQGYAKCNVCTVSDNALITEDEGIAKACKSNRIDVLLLKKKVVQLPGYDYGFIGGASSAPFHAADGTKLFFCGCIEEHPEFEKIRRFCRQYDVLPVSLSNEPLTDYGSILPLIR